MRRTVVVVVFVALVAALAATSVSLVRVHRKVRAFEAAHGGDVFACLSREQLDAKVKSAVMPSEVPSEDGEGEEPGRSADRPGPQSLSVLDLKQPESGVVRLVLSCEPDMSVAREYVSAGPLRSGGVAVTGESWYDPVAGHSRPSLLVSGDFAFGEDVTVKVRSGLPRAVRGVSCGASGALAADYVKTFRRQDFKSSVGFADKGRYLPPTGERSVAFDAVNVTNVSCLIRRVVPRNLVTFLALEEDALAFTYARRWHESWPEDFSSGVETNVLRGAAGLNERTKLRLPLAMKDGGPANGVYFVTVPEYDEARVVCVSDLALSVRDLGGGRLGAWVTSLSTGRPVADALIEAYSVKNVLVAAGTADACGWCALERRADGEPFAVIAYAADAGDMTFLALRDSMKVDETRPDGARRRYLKAGETEAFVWSDRGIYRHGEPIRVQAIVRDGGRKAPVARPVELALVDPRGNVRRRVTRMTEGDGTVAADDFSVDEDLPSGKWKLTAKVPGKDGRVLGSREIKIEEFAPPRIRVTVAPAKESSAPADFAFRVSAEHLSGGPASGQRAEGAVLFEDVPFEPAGWKGWTFGNADLELKPNFRRLTAAELDESGATVFDAPLPEEAGRPRAAVKVTAEGTVFEDGGRPATARTSAILHAYPYYLGSTLPAWMKRPASGRPKMALVCVSPDGKRLAEAKELVLKLESVSNIHSYRESGGSWAKWRSEMVRASVVDDVKVSVPAEGAAEVELPVAACGEYAVTVSDPATGVSFGRTFYLSDWGDDEVRTSLGDPSKVTLMTDKDVYRVGEVPQLTVRAPFAGVALLTVLRESERYTEVLTLTNATSSVALRPVTAADAPNLEVRLSVVQGVEANAKRLAVRAHGEATVAVRPREDEIPVTVTAELANGLTSVSVKVLAPGATSAVVTVVDEGINLFTDEPVPDPVGGFAALRLEELPLHDLYHRVLPVYGLAPLGRSGVKTGGGSGEGLLGRVSPVPTRRFRPLALWSGRLAVKDGVATTKFALPEFAGELRVTAVAVSDRACGSAAVHRKVEPKLVMEADAPRFVAPGDEFDAVIPVRNRSGADGHFMALVLTNGVVAKAWKDVRLAKDGKTNLVLRLTAPSESGELRLGCQTRGFGELHRDEIPLPVRPAVAWRETAGVKRLAPGEEFKPEGGRFTYRVFDSPLAELASALGWLAEYPYGCLEQTTSRCFPLIVAGGVLGAASPVGAKNAADCAAAGVRRVESMVRSHDFVMWPDCKYAPWDREVSLYAAHFLAEAEKAGLAVNPSAKWSVQGFLSRWAMSTNTTVSAYACHTLALAGRPERDRMLRLYDARASLTLLSRARLARAFVRVGDRQRAETLLANAESPASVKEAAFATLALLELDPDDARIPSLVAYLLEQRDRSRLSWGTTETNAHALLALGEYYRRHPPAKGERFVAWRKLTLPAPDEVKAEAEGISIRREFLTPEGKPADLSALRQGDLLTVKLTLGSDDARTLSDLVIEDLLPGCFEPVRSAAVDQVAPACDWVMRSDARDDRMLVFSKKFDLAKDGEVTFDYRVRAVSTGVYTLPGVAAEGMYHPRLHARIGVGRVVVRP